MKKGTIPFAWLSLTSTPIDAKRLLKLHAEVERRGIDHHDLPAVKAIWDEIYKGPGPEVVKNWGMEIANYRESHKISKTEFAKRADMSVAAVTALENGTITRPIPKEAAIRRILWGQWGQVS